MSPALRSHYAQDMTTLARCWRLTRRDGLVLGFTSHDQDIVIEGVVYKASTGATGSALRATGDLGTDNQDIQSVLSDDAITDADLLAGKYDGARVDLFEVDWRNPPAALAPGAVLWLKTAYAAEVTWKRGGWRAELRGYADLLNQRIGEVVTQDCLATLGDARCRVALASFSAACVVAGTTGDRGVFFADPQAAAPGWWRYGRAEFTSGKCQGLTLEIASHDGGLIRFYEAPPFPLAVGDAFTLVAGCDKRLATCKTKFGNVVNFRGFPHLPGYDKWLAGVVPKG